MARPFATQPDLPTPYPSSEELKKALEGTTHVGRLVVARLWVTEGCPAVFRSCPATYEDLRGWLASRLAVHPKEITMIGSARLGYSLAPPPKFGNPFSDSSDLDLSIISSNLFQRVGSAFSTFAEDYGNGAVRPRSERERGYWEANVAFGDRNISRGFFDANKVPNFDRYPVIQQLNQAMWECIRKLNATEGAPRARKASMALPHVR